MMSIVSTIFSTLFLSSGYSSGNGIQLQKSFPRVTTTLGTIEGFYRTSSNGRPFKAFQGIPYAEPPMGELRFEVPYPVSSWTGVLEAKKYSSACLQYNATTSGRDPVRGSEDCLYLNIFTPIMKQNPCKSNRSSSTLLPVIFFIHGGAFEEESASGYEPDYLLDRDNIIVVTINYRLGILGFLSTEDEIIPGNMGLKDQVIALRWVKNNIKSFGGDPSRVLITGQSAGAASVHYHYLTNMTRGLFQGGMSLSGSALQSWALTENSLEKAKKLAAIVGCPTDVNQSMVKCLKSKPGHQLLEAVSQFKYWLDNPGIPFGPVIEKPGGEFTFIDRSPIDVITSGDAQDLPWITSNVSEEGIYIVSNIITNATRLEELNRNWTNIAPHFLDFNYTIPYLDHARIARLIRKHYFGSKPIDESTVKQIISVSGDRTCLYDGGKAARLHARYSQSPVRLYYFSYRGAHSFSDLTTGTNKNFGVDHKDDLSYVFQIGVDTTSTCKDLAVHEKLIDLWISFATDLTPNVGSVTWVPVKKHSKNLNYLHIAEPEDIFMDSSQNYGDVDFWDSLGFQENIPIQN